MEGLSHFRDRISSAWRNVRLDSRAPIVLFFLICTIEWTPTRDIVRTGQLRALLLIAGFYCYSVIQRAVTKPVALFLSYMVVMWVLHNYHLRGANHIFNVVAALVVARVLARAPRLSLWISLMGLFQATFGLAQYLGWNAWGYANAWELGKPSGFFGQETLLGAFLAASFAPALFTRRYYAAIPIFLCALATDSTMTVAATSAVFLLWLWKVGGYRLPLAVSTIFGGFLVAKYLSNPDLYWFSSTGRIDFWRMAFHKWQERKLFGWGPGTWFDFMIIDAHGFHVNYVHNEYLELLVEYGLVGALIAVFAIFSFLRGFKLTWYHAMVVALLVNAAGSFIFHIPPLGTIFLTGWLLSVRERPSVLQFQS